MATHFTLIEDMLKLNQFTNKRRTLSMITIITCIVILALFIIQFIMYKKEEQKGLKHFIKSSQLWDIIKEFLIILLGATIALNATSFVEEQNDKQHVIKLLEIAESDIEQEYDRNNILIAGCEEAEENVNVIELMAHQTKRTYFFETILNNETVLAYISPAMYSIMTNSIFNINFFYEEIQKQILLRNANNISVLLKAINSECENIRWAITMEIEHLRDNYSEEELSKKKDIYYVSKYLYAMPN